MPKDTKSSGNNKAPACESRGFGHKKEGENFDTPSLLYPDLIQTIEITGKQKEFILLIISHLHISCFLHFCPILPVFCYSVHF